MSRLALLLPFAALIGCSPAGATRPTTYSGSYPIPIVCTTGMVADVVKNVGGNWVQVKALFGPGIDPHTYHPNTQDVRTLSSATFIFYNGLHLEGKMSELFQELSHRLPCVAVAEKLPKEKLLFSENIGDPHVWFDVQLWSETVNEVVSALGEFDPGHASEYRASGEKYRSQLLALHTEVAKELATIAKDRRVLITSHDAFRYFGKAYDIEVKGVQGISTESEASVKDIEELVRFITARQIKAIFVETSVNPRNMKALQEGCQAKGYTLRVGGELYSDALGEPGSGGDTYEKMIRHNVETIVKALK